MRPAPFIFDQTIDRDKKRKEEEIKQRLERFTQFFGRVNSAFTFRKVTVRVENSPMNAPAWSGASDVVFNSRVIGDLKDARSIAGIKGLDLHEISHILYTSREGSDLFDYVRDNNYFMAYNALEDQRIETLFTSKYPSTVDWFTATILIHFVDDQESFKNSYPLLRGRRYLPVELRARSRNAYSQQDQIDEICSIVDEYRTLIFPTDTEKGKDLIARFNDLLPKSDGGETGTGTGTGTGTTVSVTVKIKDPFGHGERPQEGLESSVTSRPIAPKKQEKDRDRSQQLDKEDDLELSEQLKQDELMNEDIEAIDLEIELGFDDSDSDSDSDDADDATDSSDNAGDSAGDVIATLIGDLLDNILENNDQEINDILRQIGGLPSLSTNNSKEPELDQFRELTIDANTHGASVTFGRELERLKASFDPAWEQYESQGRLQAIRFFRGDELDTIFDRWNEGIEDATEISCVILLDNSGSMSGSKATNAYRAMYAIKRALDRINAETTVITFNDEAKTLYRPTDRAGNTIRDAGTGGGTVANGAIAYATKLLAETEKPVRIFFAITDGEWSGDQQDNNEAIERMARAGVLTAFAYIPEMGEGNVELDYEKKHHCEIGAVVRNPFDLVYMAKAIVKHAISRRLVNN
jgi:predicted metal-dependent peptidase